MFRGEGVAVVVECRGMSLGDGVFELRFGGVGFPLSAEQRVPSH